MTLTTTSIVLFVWLAQSATPARETENKAKAKVLVAEGSVLYKRGDYVGALESFEAAYAAFPSPKLWFNIGQANRDLGRPVEALSAFEKFVGLASEASPSALEDAQASMAALRKKLGQLRIECALAGTEVSLDGRSLGQTPLPGAVWATPGRHQLTATHSGAPIVVENPEVKAGTLQTIVVPMSQATLPASAAPSQLGAAAVKAQAREASQVEPGWWLGRKWTWVAAGSAVVLAGSVAVVGGLAQSRFNDLKKSCGSASPDRAGCIESDINSLQTRMTTANVLWGLAGAAAVTAGVLFFVEDHAVAVAPMLGESKGMFATVEF